MSIEIPTVPAGYIPPKQFSPDLEREAARLHLRDKSLRDRPPVPGVTIDGPYSLDLDDAFWIEETPDGYHIDISITDVPALIAQGSPLDNEALRRVVTHYFKEGNAPMLPRTLSENHLSLVEGRLRPTITISIDLTQDLKIKNHPKIRRTTLVSQKRFSYAEADKAIASPETNSFGPMLKVANTLAQRLSARRRQEGALVIFDPSHHLIADEDGQVIEPDTEKEHSSNLIIQELMLLAGHILAQFAEENRIHILFRNHHFPIGKTREDVQREIASIIPGYNDPERLRETINRLVGRATYGAYNEGHEGLNFTGYAQVGSPLRRAADLINLRQVLAHTEGEKPPYSLRELAKIAEYIQKRIIGIGQKRKQEASKAHIDDTLVEIQTITNPNGYSSIPPEQFIHYIKTARHHGVLTEALKTAILQRIENHNLRTIDLLEILFKRIEGEGWEEIVTKGQQELVNSPAVLEMLYLLNHRRGDRWSAPEYTEYKTLREFSAKVVVTIDGAPRTTESSAKGKSIQEARTAATRLFFEDYFTKRLVPYTPTKERSKPGSTNPQKSIEPVLEAGRQDPIIALHMLCQHKGWPSPTYSEKRLKPGHQHKFTHECRVTVGDKTYCSTGKEGAPNKPLSKRNAALELLKILADEGLC